MTNQQDYSPYQVTCEIYTSDNNTIDISSYLQEIIIQHSITLNQPIVHLSVTRTIIQTFQAKISYVNLTIKSVVNQNVGSVTDKFKLLPKRSDLNLLYDSSAAGDQAQMPSSALISLEFYIQPVYKFCNTQLTPSVYHDTTIETVINNIVTTNGAELDCTNFATDSIDQAFIPHNTLINVLHYLVFQFAITQNLNFLTVNYDIKNQKPTVICRDILTCFQQEHFDITIDVLVSPTAKETSWQKQIQDRTYFISQHGVSFNYNTPQEYFKEANSIIHPTDSLYQQQTYNYSDLAIAYRGFDMASNGLNELSLNNQSVLNLTNFSGTPTAYLHKLQYISAISGESTIDISDIVSLQNLYPGCIVKIKYADPSYAKLVGLYLLQSFSYILKRESIWENSTQVTLLRANVSWQ